MIGLVEEPEPWTYRGAVVVVDTSVLVDFALESAKLHADAVLLFRLLLERGIRIRAPYHAAFEFLATVRRQVLFEGAIQSSQAGVADQSLVVAVHAVPINSAFSNHYTTTGLPQLKAGDLLFLALARGDGATLITEDIDLHKKAVATGVRCFKIRQYLENGPA
jgi:predicted nucleic acid-binding protein